MFLSIELVWFEKKYEFLQDFCQIIVKKMSQLLGITMNTVWI
jgi:hypothetical protein